MVKYWIVVQISWCYFVLIEENFKLKIFKLKELVSVDLEIVLV